MQGVYDLKEKDEQTTHYKANKIIRNRDLGHRYILQSLTLSFLRGPIRLS